MVKSERFGRHDPSIVTRSVIACQIGMNPSKSPPLCQSQVLKSVVNEAFCFKKLLAFTADTSQGSALDWPSVEAHTVLLTDF
jgi:hypothetical protein